MSDTKVDAAAVMDIVRSTPPPPGFEAFAVAMGSVAQSAIAVFGVAVDPLRPTDIITAPGNSFTVPPRCPACHTLVEHTASHVPDARYRCSVCRLDFVLDLETNSLRLAPMLASDEQTAEPSKKPRPRRD